MLALTMGDPAGIGPEIAVKALTSIPWRRLGVRCLVVGSCDLLDSTAKNLRLKWPFPAFSDLQDFRASSEMVGVLDRKTARLRSVVAGRASAAAGRASVDYVRYAASEALAGRVDAVVTCPINKDAIARAGCRYEGHTELLRDLAGVSRTVMMLVAEGLRVALVTTHLALQDVPGRLSRPRLTETITITHDHLRSYFGVPAPRIIVCALNPHASDSGRFGSEEKKIIAPAVARVVASGIKCTGPLPADTAFVIARRTRADAVVCMYHDQALIPVKLLGFGRGVNVTLGLPFVRTSVDHGTAFDIVGKGVADPGSLVAAVEMAVEIIRRRSKGGAAASGRKRRARASH